MTFYFEDEASASFPFDCNEICAMVIEKVLELEQCPYDVQVNILLTDSDGIHQFNKEYRNVDAPTDVLSFPNISFETISDFSIVEECSEDYFDPDSGELILGDIILNADRIHSQALDFGHSELREFAFLIAHSMLHLCGYDHMESDEASVMEERQRTIMNALQISRD